MWRRSEPAPGQLALGLVDDAQAIREALVIHLRAGRRHARFIPEMGMNHGAARIDLAVVDDTLDGYEIKSRGDDLRRLGGQAAAYGQVFDMLTLVSDERHVRAAARTVPGWWGLSIVDTTSCSVTPLRSAEPNPAADLGSLVRLLWRPELESILDDRSGRRSAVSNAVLRERLVNEMAADDVRAVVRRCLTARPDWRAAG